MAEVKKYIAVDLGAESGRVMLGSVSAERLVLEEIHRFGNGPIEDGGSLRWDFNRLLSEIKTGIGKAAKEAGSEVKGIGIDSWGVDFGLLDADGKLIDNPYHYRDSQTEGMQEKAFEMMGKRAIYDNTGIQFMVLNSVYQLLAMRLRNSESLARARKLVFVGDLFTYFLCGEIFAEYSLASTSQFMDMRTGQWSRAVLEGLSLPAEIMPKIVDPGTVVGRLSDEIQAELGCGPIPVIAVGSHDTASAVAAVPAVCGKDAAVHRGRDRGEGVPPLRRDIQGRDALATNWAYLSSGTWSLMGIETPQAIINDKTFKYEFTNEGGVEKTIRLLKNIMGLWPVQECRRQWQREGEDLSYPELTALAEKAEPFARRINVDDPAFLAPGDMPTRINEYLVRTGQEPINEKGQMVRAILENLALKYRSVMEAIEDVGGSRIEVMHIVGGGIQNELLCQFTADALGRKVVAGPIEATASGNVLMQAIATGQIKSLAEGRQIVRQSFDPKEYQPEDTATWQRQYEASAK